MARWKILQHEGEAVSALAQELSVSHLLASLILSRGYDTPEKAYRFLYPSESDIHDPSLLEGIRPASHRIFKAIENREPILIWGDYDVDGTTGTVVLRKTLEMLSGISEYHIPNRFTEGYGLNIEKLSEAKARGVGLVISVDTGARAFEAANWAKENGLDLIITDHHLVDQSEGNPPAYAVINPNQPACGYPDKHLAGVGVAFKLAHALLREKGLDRYVASFMKMAAIGTVADVMSLTGENRAIVALGLRDLPNTRNHGLRALMEVADCSNRMTSYDIGFRIGPRINAAGRMDAAKAVVELFEAENYAEAQRLAKLLDERNRDRQQTQKKIFELALTDYLDRGGADKQSHVAVLAGNGWHRGVIGLAASRVAERIHRPCLVISIEDGIGHGSARSIRNYHLLEGLDSCGHLFEKYGGHAAACGFTIKEDNIAGLRESLNQHAVQALSEDDLVPEITVDAAVTSDMLGLGLVNEISRLEPFGQGNPKPVFFTEGLIMDGEPFVMKEKHLKLRLTDRGGRRFEAVWWDGVEKLKERTLNDGDDIKMVYTPEVNAWNGVKRLQLVVKDVKLS